ALVEVTVMAPLAIVPKPVALFEASRETPVTTGATPAPPPFNNVLAVHVAVVPIVVVVLKYGMPPELPVRLVPVPPLAVGRTPVTWAVDISTAPKPRTE